MQSRHVGQMWIVQRGAQNFRGYVLWTHVADSHLWVDPGLVGDVHCRRIHVESLCSQRRRGLGKCKPTYNHSGEVGRPEANGEILHSITTNYKKNDSIKNYKYLGLVK